MSVALFRLKMELTGGQVFSRALGVVADQVDLRLAAPACRSIFHANRKKDFLAEGAHGGSKWKRLTPGYAKWKRRNFPGKTILRRTDNLMASLSSSGHPDSVFRISHDSIAMGTRVHYAQYHADSRPPLRMNEAERRAYLSAIHQSIVANLGGGTGLKRSAPGKGFGSPRAWAADD